MSTLWTPGGEVPVGDRAAEAGSSETAPASADADASAPPDGFDLDDLSPEEREQAEQYIRDLAESRERLRSVPAAVVVANHAMGLYELAALHLAYQPPNFAEAAVAIDALVVLMDGMKGRLGEAEATLREGLSQIQMAYVQLKNRPTENSDDTGSGNSGSAADQPGSDTTADSDDSVSTNE